jgi:hypothetical protein
VAIGFRADGYPGRTSARPQRRWPADDLAGRRWPATPPRERSMFITTLLAATDDDSDIEALAESVGVLRR